MDTIIILVIIGMTLPVFIYEYYNLKDFLEKRKKKNNKPKRDTNNPVFRGNKPIIRYKSDK